METLAYPRNLYYYLRKAHIITELGKKIFPEGFYYSNTTYYKAILAQYANFESYINIFRGTLQLGSLHTDKNIQSDILGADSRTVLSKYGKPDFIFTSKNLSVYVYKWKFNGMKTRCEVHLHKNKAFLVNHIYNHLDKNERDYILDMITGKYLHQYTNKIDFDHNKISDKNSNVMFVSDYLLGMKVSYLSNCESDWYEEMASVVNAKRTGEAERKRSGEKRFFSRI